MKLNKYGNFKFSSDYKYWEFYAFLIEHIPTWNFISLDYPVCKTMAIGFQRYKKNKNRHERPNSRFNQMLKNLKKR